jgi:WD40 repeat protein
VNQFERQGLRHGTLALTADGRRAIFATWDDALEVMDLNTDRAVQTVRGHTGLVFDVAVTADGRRAATASADATVRIWDLTTGSNVATFTGDSYMSCCALTFDDRGVVAGDTLGRIHVLRLENA